MKAFANQPLALGFAPLHDLGTIHVGGASAVNPTGNFAPLKRSNKIIDRVHVTGSSEAAEP